ncbi:MAG: PilZ domain-containing protein [Nitrospiraceae bacterium]
MELRDRPRHEVMLPVSYTGDQISGQGTVGDLSMGGCGIKGQSRIPVGSFVELIIDLPGFYKRLTVDLAVVRWTIGSKFGLDFLQMQPEQEELLQKFIGSL